MLGDELLELSDHFGVPAEPELGLHPLLERSEPHLLEPTDRRLGKGFVSKVSKRRSAPESKRSPQEFSCRVRIATFERPTGLLREPLKAVQVELLRREV